MHQKMLTALIALVILGVVLTLGVVWDVFNVWDLYVKAMITIGILVLLIGFLLVIKTDLGEQKKLKDENYID